MLFSVDAVMLFSVDVDVVQCAWMWMLFSVDVDVVQCGCDVV
jgi:hypothetical protein